MSSRCRNANTICSVLVRITFNRSVCHWIAHALEKSGRHAGRCLGFRRFWEQVTGCLPSQTFALLRKGRSSETVLDDPQRGIEGQVLEGKWDDPRIRDHGCFVEPYVSSPWVMEALFTALEMAQKDAATAWELLWAVILSPSTSHKKRDRRCEEKHVARLLAQSQCTSYLQL